MVWANSYLTLNVVNNDSAWLLATAEQLYKLFLAGRKQVDMMKTCCLFIYVIIKPISDIWLTTKSELQLMG